VFIRKLSSWRSRVSQAAATVQDGFRTYRGSAALLAGMSALAMVAVYPVLLFAPTEHGPSLSFSTVRGSRLGLDWLAPPLSPTVVQAQTVAELSNLLLGSAGAVLLILLLAMMTLAFARAAAREGEFGVRRAIGASRRSLFLASLLEAGGIGFAAILVGGGVGHLTARFAASTWPGETALPRHWPGLLPGGAILVLVLVGVLLPGLMVKRARLVEFERRPLAVFVPAVIQIGVSLVLLVLAGWFARTVISTTGPDQYPGNGLVYRIESPASTLPQVAAAYGSLLAAAAKVGGVSAVSLTSPGAIVGLGPVAHVTTDCGQCSEGGLPIRWRKPRATHQFVSADSFRTMGIRVLAGRGITSADSWDAPRVAVVGRALATRHFQSGEALGRQVRVGVGGDQWYTVVGVVEDPAVAGFGASRQPPFTIYLSILQHPVRSADLLVRGLPAPVLASRIRAVLGPQAVDPHPTAERAIIAAERAPIAWFGRWLALEGWVMTAIASVGVFAFVRSWLTSLRPELGHRRAVGARRRQILHWVLARAVLIGLAGVALGVWLGVPVWDGISHLIPGSPGWSLELIAPPALLLLGVALAAAVLPAWRATHEAPARLLGDPSER
jgi:hypothetical protein